jgi:hypothetical protein
MVFFSSAVIGGALTHSKTKHNMPAVKIEAIISLYFVLCRSWSASINLIPLISVLSLSVCDLGIVEKKYKKNEYKK